MKRKSNNVKKELFRIRKQIRLRVSKSDPTLGYISLPNHAGGYGSVDNTIDLLTLLKFKGPSIYLDFKNGELIGIEIVS